MKAILSADRKWGLGYQGRLLVSIPSDLRFFRETTMGHVVVMGRKTLATLPAGQPLKPRSGMDCSRCNGCAQHQGADGSVKTIR